MDKATQQEVRRRADFRCEYCHMPQAPWPLTFPIDHIVARKHGGKSTLDNLAMSCPHCNLHKGTDLAGMDPETGALTPLFNPRIHAWPEHFRYEDGLLIGLTPMSRTTIAVLSINHPDQITMRQSLTEEELF